MTPAQIDELLALANAATPGPWRVGTQWTDCVLAYDRRQHPAGGSGSEMVVLRMNKGLPNADADAAFVATVRDAVPELIDALLAKDIDLERAEREVRAKDAEIERLRATLGDVHQSLGGIIDSESPGGWRLGSPYASQPGGNVLIHTPDGHLTTLHKSLLATWLTRLTEALR